MEKINGDDLVYPLIVDNMMHGPIVHHGLSKREYFAAMAMQGWCANHDWAKSLVKDDWDDYIDRLSAGAVEMADKIILELNKH